MSDKGVCRYSGGYTGREGVVSRTFKCNSRACFMRIVCKCFLNIVAGNIYLQILIMLFHGSTTNDDNFSESGGQLRCAGEGEVEAAHINSVDASSTDKESL